MPRGPKAREVVRSATRTLAVDQPGLTYRDIRQRVRQTHGALIPGQDWFRKEVADARRKRDPDLDAPWSMAAFVTSPSFISQAAHDATGDLLTLWRMASLMDEPFTVRHAIWAVRLRGAFKDLGFGQLYRFARQYAARERSGLAEVGSADIDADLAFRSMMTPRWSLWVYNSGEKSGLLPTRRWDYVSEEGYAPDFDTTPVSSHVESRLYVQACFELEGESGLADEKVDAFSPTQLVYDAQSVLLRKKPDPDGVIEAASYVYAMWLRRAASTQRWRGLSLSDRVMFFHELSRAVKRQTDRIASLIMTKTGLTIDREEEWTPVDVFERFGIPMREGDME